MLRIFRDEILRTEIVEKGQVFLFSINIQLINVKALISPKKVFLAWLGTKICFSTVNFSLVALKRRQEKLLWLKK